MAFQPDFKFDIDFKKLEAKKVKRIVLIGAIVLFLLLLVSTCWFTVNDKQQAVILGDAAGNAQISVIRHGL